MIRFAESYDTDKIVSLWNVCFPDSSGFNEWFFDNIYDHSNTLLYFKSDNLCAMLQMLPRNLKLDQTAKPVTYIYGACTAPECRKQGLMAELLDHSFDLDSRFGRYASVLIPQEPWLFDFYKKFGYEPAFYLKNYFIYQDDNTYSKNICLCKEEDIKSLDKIYNDMYPTIIMRSHEHWKQQLNLFSEIGVGAYCLKEDGVIKAYAFLWEQDDYLWAQEALAVDEMHLNCIAQQIMKEKNISKIKLTGNNGTERFGCAKIYETNGLSFNEKAYMNLLFN